MAYMKKASTIYGRGFFTWWRGDDWFRTNSPDTRATLGVVRKDSGVWAFAAAPPTHHSVQISNQRIRPLGFSCKQRLHDSPDNSCGKVPRMDGLCMTQVELAERWRIS